MGRSLRIRGRYGFEVIVCFFLGCMYVPVVRHGCEKLGSDCVLCVFSQECLKNEKLLKHGRKLLDLKTVYHL